MYAVGFDFADSSYLSGICESTGGKFLRAQTSEELSSVYQTIETFLSQDYVIRFTVKEDEKDYEWDIRIALENGVFDERDYFVGVDSKKIEKEANLPPKANFFEQIGGSGKRRRAIREKVVFAGIGVCSLALIAALYAWFMTGGTRLLYENSSLGQVWRLYPWGLLSAAGLAVIGCICMVKGYVKKADRKPKMRPQMMSEMPVYAAPEETQQPIKASPAVQQGVVCPSCGTMNESNAFCCIRCGCLLLCEQSDQNDTQNETSM